MIPAKTTIPTVLAALFIFIQLSNDALAEHQGMLSQTKPLKLKLLIEEAEKNNHKLQAMRHEIDVARAQIGPAGAFDDPMLGFEIMDYPVSSGDQSELTKELTISQKVPFPGKLSQKSQAQKSSAEAAEAIFNEEKAQLVMMVKKAYFNLVVAFEQQRSLEEQQKIYEQLIILTRNNYAIGKIEQAEVLNMQVEASGIMDKILTAKRALSDAAGEINHLLGRAEHQQFIYGNPEPLAKTSLDLTALNEEKLFQLARVKYPGLVARNLQIEAASANLSAARMNLYPDFEFKLGYRWRERTAADDGDKSVSAMVGINLPLWAGSKQVDERSSALAEKSKAEALRDEVLANLSHQIHLIFAELKETSQRLTLYSGGILPLARQAVKTSEASYLARKLDYATLISAINRRFQLELEYSEALANHETKVAELEALLGGELPGDDT